MTRPERPSSHTNDLPSVEDSIRAVAASFDWDKLAITTPNIGDLTVGNPGTKKPGDITTDDPT